MTSPNGTQAVDRAAQLLIDVVRCPGPVTFTELASASGLAKSTTSRLLMALERNGLVQRDSKGGFRPGEVFVSYAWRSGAEAGLIPVAQPFLERLGDARNLAQVLLAHQANHARDDALDALEVADRHV